MFEGEPFIGEPSKIDDLGWFGLNNLPDKLTLGARIFFATKVGDVVRNRYVDLPEYEKIMNEKFNL